MEQISEVKKRLLQMKDDKLFRLLRLACKERQTDSSAGRSKESQKTSGAAWYDQVHGRIDPTCEQRLAEEKRRLRANPGSNTDRKWIRYAEAFRGLQFRVPDLFRTAVQPKALYNWLLAFCTEHDIPQEVLPVILPSLISYIRTGRMRPIIICGEKGCGKTTAFRLLIQEALGIPVAVIKVPEEDAGHGLTGTCGSYASADMGAIGRAMLRENSPVVGLLFDEIDKAPHSRSHACIDDELLSITDESVSTVVDKYLESTLSTLPYCPLFMTCNDLHKVSPILADRCTVIHFPRASVQRLRSVTKKFARAKLEDELYQAVQFDFGLLDQSINALASYNVYSLRKHQQLVENVLQKAFHLAMLQPDGQEVCVTKEMFKSAESEILGIEQRRIGFG